MKYSIKAALAAAGVAAMPVTAQGQEQDTPLLVSLEEAQAIVSSRLTAPPPEVGAVKVPPEVVDIPRQDLSQWTLKPNTSSGNVGPTVGDNTFRLFLRESWRSGTLPRDIDSFIDDGASRLPFVEGGEFDDDRLTLRFKSPSGSSNGWRLDGFVGRHELDSPLKGMPDRKGYAGGLVFSREY